MVGHCSNQIPQQPEKEQQSLSDEEKSIISMHCPEAGVQNSSQSQNKKWLRNDAQIPANVTEMLVDIQPWDQGGDCTPAAQGAAIRDSSKGHQSQWKKALTDFIKFWNSS